MFAWYDQQALNMRPVNLLAEMKNLTSSLAHLAQGSNVFAIQIHARIPNSISASFNLSIVGDRQVIGPQTPCKAFNGYMMPSGQLFDPVAVPEPGYTPGL